MENKLIKNICVITPCTPDFVSAAGHQLVGKGSFLLPVGSQCSGYVNGENYLNSDEDFWSKGNAKETFLVIELEPNDMAIVSDWGFEKVTFSRGIAISVHPTYEEAMQSLIARNNAIDKEAELKSKYGGLSKDRPPVPVFMSGHFAGITGILPSGSYAVSGKVQWPGPIQLSGRMVTGFIR